MNANTTEMTIEAIKKQIEPQINRLIENIIRLQQAIATDVNVIPADLVWDYGSNERFDDMKKLQTLQAIQRTTRIPYSIRAQIVTPILNKLIDEPTNNEDLVKAYKEEEKDINLVYEEI